MGKISEGNVSALELDGAFRKIPGYESGKRGDELPMLVVSGAIALDSAQADQNPHYFPFDAKIQSASIIYPTAPDADAVVQIGTTSANTHFDAHTADASALSDGNREDDITLSNADIDAGDVVVFGSDGGSTSSATAHVTLVVTPR